MTAIDITALKPTIKIKPPTIVLYGTEKIGKSTFASQAPNPIFAACEPGQDAILTTKQKIDSTGEMRDLLNQLITKEHNFKTLVVDTVDRLEKYIFEQVLAETGAKTIDQEDHKSVNFGRGANLAANIWSQFIDAFEILKNEKNMCIILIAHEEIKRFEDPQRVSYDKYRLRINQKGADTLRAWADCIMFASHKVHIEKEKKSFTRDTRAIGKNAGRFLYTEEGAGPYVAGNRYFLPEEIPFTWDDFQNAFADSVQNLTKPKGE